MKEPRVTPQAEADLLEVWLHVAKGGEARADAFVDEIFQQFRQLARFPRMGRSRANLAPAPVLDAAPPTSMYKKPPPIESIIAKNPPNMPPITASFLLNRTSV